MAVPLEKRSNNYRRILAYLVQEGRKTKVEIAEALKIGETSARECLLLAQRDGRIYVCDWRVPACGQPAKVYAFGQGETPPQPRGNPPSFTGRKEPEMTAEMSRQITEETLKRARANASREFNPFASLMAQV
jgi:predicted ArsR family transcriptional regulator